MSCSGTSDLYAACAEKKEGRHVDRLAPSRIPTFAFPQIHIYTDFLLESDAHQVEDSSSPVRGTDEIDVV